MPIKIVKPPVQDGKEDTVTAVAKDDISLIERVGDNRPKQFNSHLILRQFQHHLKPEQWLDI